VLYLSIIGAQRLGLTQYLVPELSTLIRCITPGEFKTQGMLVQSNLQQLTLFYQWLMCAYICAEVVVKKCAYYMNELQAEKQD